MRRLAFFLFLLLTALLCKGAEDSNTLVLPREKVLPLTLEKKEIFIAGQKKFQVLTDHYEIIASLPEDGILVAERMEFLGHVWDLLAADFVKEPEKEPVQHRHRVILYRNKQEYVSNLLRLDSAIAQTNGYYFAPRKTAYFYTPEPKVLFHEGTHQIFVERFYRGKKPAFRNNFWAVEGIALFMETLQVEEKCYKIGNIFDNRLYAAKVYRFERNYHLPIQKLTAMSAKEIQNSEEMVRIYSHSAALVHWLMFVEEGRYREALFELLRRTYLDTAKPETLSKLTNLSYEELDKKYEEFLKTIPDEPNHE
ncbi:MAG: hypothetical protein LBI05_00495 [Planctomycetaceae bacterium]|jgi:hypothetical protein|nr:hypothetical protein [Planctomycetaceae bacterium]